MELVLMWEGVSTMLFYTYKLSSYQLPTSDSQCPFYSGLPGIPNASTLISSVRHLQSGRTGTLQGAFGSALHCPPTISDESLPQAGDFGTVLRSTGEFVVEGNIYVHKDLAHIAIGHPPSEAHAIDQYHVHSRQVRSLGASAGLGRTPLFPWSAWLSCWCNCLSYNFDNIHNSIDDGIHPITTFYLFS